MATSPAQLFTSVEWIPPEVAVFGQKPQQEPTPFDAPSSDEMYEMLERAGACIREVNDE